MSNQAKHTAAKRGDLVLFHVQSSFLSLSLASKRTETNDFTVGMVTSVTRDGLVKLYRPAGDLTVSDHLGRPYRGQGLPRTGLVAWWMVPASKIDVTGAMVTAATHLYPQRETPMPYGSLDEVRAALKPHLRASAGWETLHAAALEWEAARRAAWDAYEQMRRDANRAHAAAGYHTREGDALRWRLDGEAMEAHAAAVARANDTYRAVLTRVTQATAASMPGQAEEPLSASKTTAG
jgi:hypothetical protein